MKKRMLVLSAHPDDGELGCGGTIARYIEEGWTVVHAVFCASENIGTSVLPKEVMLDEFELSNKVLGIHKTFIYDFPHRRLNESRQDILEEMCELNRTISPDLVLLPSTDDLHQDHLTISNEGLRAFKMSNMWGYEMLWNNLMFDSRTFVILEERHIDKKVEALLQYTTQQFKPYFNPNFVKSLASVRGIQIGHAYAEVFQHIRGII
jgi:LmbE family N-acetylglucosaminyl deacetylase